MPVLFTVNIKCDNSAFCDEVGTSERSAAPELARILRDIARRLDNGDRYNTFRTILDVNGNDVGRFAIKSVPFR
jgi:hypothetical protein